MTKNDIYLALETKFPHGGKLTVKKSHFRDHFGTFLEKFATGLISRSLSTAVGRFLNFSIYLHPLPILQYLKKYMQWPMWVFNSRIVHLETTKFRKFQNTISQRLTHQNFWINFSFLQTVSVISANFKKFRPSSSDKKILQKCARQCEPGSL